MGSNPTPSATQRLLLFTHVYNSLQQAQKTWVYWPFLSIRVLLNLPVSALATWGSSWV